MCDISDEFAEVMRKTVLHKKLPFNMESTFVRLYFGKDKKRLVTYQEFSQFLHDFHEEYGVEAFKKCDKDGSGFITAGDFKDIMLSVKSHLLTKDLKTKVINVSFDFFFNSVVWTQRVKLYKIVKFG
jgi:solute carrier family 25 (mitochondrial aspartate/glutamate transporter), member 12/13